jgi:hypothetical protein
VTKRDGPNGTLEVTNNPELLLDAYSMVLRSALGFGYEEVLPLAKT